MELALPERPYFPVVLRVGAIYSLSLQTSDPIFHKRDDADQGHSIMHLSLIGLSLDAGRYC